MASTFKMEPMTYRVGTSWMSGKGTTQVKLDRAGYLSATPVYGQVKNTNARTARKTPFKNEIIGYDASIMTKVEYRQPVRPAPGTGIVPFGTAAKEVPGKGANRGAVGSLGAVSNPGVAGSAQAGLVGSVNTEVQNDDMLLPYQKV
mgnify:CR=1 FL=1